MASHYTRENITVKETGQTATIPNDCTARLMYYLNCMCHLLDLNDDASIQRYRNYNNYENMTQRDKNAIIRLCQLLNPRFLINKCIFQSDELCGSNSNKFYELTSNKVSFSTVDSILIGGVSRNVNNIMVFKMEWLRRYYTNPLEELIEELRTPRVVQYRIYATRACNIS